jgi:hypothetical protein
MRRQKWVRGLAVLLVGFAVPARADLVISIGNASVPQGGTTTVDVLLTSNASSLSPDEIDNYGFQLQVKNNGLDGTQLAFATTQDFSYISNTALNPSYVFLGDSFAALPPPSTIGGPSTTVYPNDTFTGADSTASGNPVSLSSGTTYLLASLTLTTATGSGPVAGDSFTISLVPTFGSGSMFDNPTTFFNNFDFNNTGTQLTETAFTSTPGTVRLSSPPGVPEPASIVLGLTGMLILASVVGVRRLAAKKKGQERG